MTTTVSDFYFDGRLLFVSWTLLIVDLVLDIMVHSVEIMNEESAPLSRRCI